MARLRTDELLIGEWACLGIVALGTTHGFAVAAMLKPSGEVGRVWSMSRALTYRALDNVRDQGLIEIVGEEPGTAGGNRTLLQITDSGRHRLFEWLDTPVAHLRDLRSELLLKLVLARLNQRSTTPMLRSQRDLVASITLAMADAPREPLDVVVMWRAESSHAALRFIERALDEGL